MKRWIIILLIFVVAGVGFYYGYRNARKPGTSRFRTVTINQNIYLAYKPISNDSKSGFSSVLSATSNVLKYTGKTKLESLIDTIADNNPAVGINNYLIEIQPDMNNKEYLFENFTWPRNESTETILTAMGREMGFQLIVKETTVQTYHPVKNDQPTILIKSSSEKTNSSSFSSDGVTVKFKNMSIREILRQCPRKAVMIEDIADDSTKYDGEMTRYDAFDDIKRELQTKLGIDLVPYDKTIKLFIIKPT